MTTLAVRTPHSWTCRPCALIKKANYENKLGELVGLLCEETSIPAESFLPLWCVRDSFSDK